MAGSSSLPAISFVSLLPCTNKLNRNLSTGNRRIHRKSTIDRSLRGLALATDDQAIAPSRKAREGKRDRMCKRCVVLQREAQMSHAVVVRDRPIRSKRIPIQKQMHALSLGE